MSRIMRRGMMFPPLIVDPVLENNSWKTISIVSEKGLASSYWSVGNEKNITVSGETLTLVIMDFGHDDLTSGGKAGITFGLKNLMASTRQMNSSNTNAGGFTSSAMYTWLQGTLLGGLPSDLQSAIKYVDKKTSAGKRSTTINTNSMKVFLLSDIEVFGVTAASQPGEGTKYSYFSATSKRVKKLSNGSGSATDWWTRSPHSDSTSGFCTVTATGYASSWSSSVSKGVCFALCV